MFNELEGDWLLLVTRWWFAMFLDFWPILMFFNFVLRILWEMIQFDDFFSTGWFDRASSKYNLKESPRNDKWKKVIFQVLYVLRVPAVSSFLREGLVIDDGSITNSVHFWDSICMEIYLYLHESFQKKIRTNHPQLKKDEFHCILFLYWNCYLPYLSFLSFFPELPILWLQGGLKGPHLAQRARSSAVHCPSSPCRSIESDVAQSRGFDGQILRTCLG